MLRIHFLIVHLVLKFILLGAGVVAPGRSSLGSYQPMTYSFQSPTVTRSPTREEQGKMEE